ncbi:RNA-guided endonuclease TnpB family protein [Okeania sp. SIO2C2]|uniref:RNA-guided endonuclease InsQ/TnpB family protein n=1 Tax=Okeania sp. SIO2C2 TaxID=2607787 RepID=UPI00257E6BEA|nr:RNA-guided endonuclease TnpB family protein [Okeania sp. SIO2C2]
MKLPRIGIVKTYEILPSVPVKNVTISKGGDNWYISFKYDECQPKPPTKKRAVIGVDVGINALATCSDGTKFANVKAYKQAKKQLTRYQRRLNKKEPASKNRAKAVKKLAKAHKKADATPRRLTAQGNAHQAVADIRAEALHKVTTWLAKNHSTIVIEDLKVSGMLKNHKLASAIADCGFYEFKRQLSYKCEWYGNELVIADRFYPSSQLCSHCGQKHKMPLYKRIYECGNCGFEADRDFNAAVNLENYVDK